MRRTITMQIYNDGFDRRVKLLGELTALSYDGDSAAVGNSLSSFMLFPDASTVYNNDVKITRHIYAGSELVLSSVCNVDNAMGSNQAGNAIRNGVRLASLEDSIAALYARHNLPFCRPDFAARAAMRRASPANPNPETFFYHSDHLGNTSFVTDRSGALTQHVEYLPFGEPLLEQRGSAGNWQTDRLFNSKEYDAETGLYYYGARYYDPRLAIWLSPDPMQEGRPGITSYHFVGNNPCNRFDPNGLTDYRVGDNIHRFNDGHDNLLMSVSESDLYQLSTCFIDDIFGYESLLNKLSYDNGYTTIEFLQDIEATLGFGLEFTYHKPKRASYADWSISNMSSTDLYNSSKLIYGFVSTGISAFVENSENIALGSNNKLYFRNYETNRIFQGNKYVKVTRLSELRAFTNVEKSCYYITAFYGCYDSYLGFQLDNNTVGYNACYQASKAAGAFAGAWAGVKMGSEVGAWMGASLGGIPGGLILGVIGGIAGAYFGEEGAAYLYNSITCPSY